jgi:hypothetical protein
MEYEFQWTYMTVVRDMDMHGMNDWCQPFCSAVMTPTIYCVVLDSVLVRALSFVIIFQSVLLSELSGVILSTGGIQQCYGGLWSLTV